MLNWEGILSSIKLIIDSVDKSFELESFRFYFSLSPFASTIGLEPSISPIAMRLVHRFCVSLSSFVMFAFWWNPKISGGSLIGSVLIYEMNCWCVYCSSGIEYSYTPNGIKSFQRIWSV